MVIDGVIVEGKVYEAVPKGSYHCSDCDLYESCKTHPLEYSLFCTGLTNREQVIFRTSKVLTENIKYRKEQSSWVSIKKRVPPCTGWYLVRYANGYDAATYGEALWDNGLNTFDKRDSEDITHWMPIPSCNDIL